MIVEFAVACAILYAVALVHATRRSMLASRQALGVLQIGAAAVAASLIPALTVYALHFHTAWALGVAPGSSAEALIAQHGLVVAVGTAAGLMLVAAVAYALAARALLVGPRGLRLVPVVAAIGALAVAAARGDEGGRFTGDDPPAALIASAVVVLFLLAALLGARRLDAGAGD